MNKSIIFCVGVFLSLIAKSQTNNSPYSVIGIGDIENSSFDRTSGMASTGIALWSKRNLIQTNPASYVRLEDIPFKTGFNIEIASRYEGINYSGNPISSATDNQSSDLQFKKIALAIKPKKWWAISAGLLPFSASNYSYFENKQVYGDNTVVNAYVQGSGNLSQFYIANSFAVNKHLSFGIHTAILFGQFSQIETIAATSVSDSLLTNTRNYSLSSPYIKLGFQYNNDISKKWNIAIGSTLTMQANLNGLYDLNVMNGVSTIKTSETEANDYFTIPVAYAGGVAATYSQKYTFAADYSYQPWTNMNNTGLGYRLVNSQRFSGGGEYSNKVKLANGFVAERYFLQAGFFYSNSYLQVNGNQIADYGGTIGAGFNSLKNGLGMSAALTVGSKGTTSMNLIKENYTQFSLTISYRDFWFTAKKKYD